MAVLLQKDQNKIITEKFKLILNCYCKTLSPTITIIEKHIQLTYVYTIRTQFACHQ